MISLRLVLSVVGVGGLLPSNETRAVFETGVASGEVGLATFEFFETGVVGGDDIVKL